MNGYARRGNPRSRLYPKLTYAYAATYTSDCPACMNTSSLIKKIPNWLTYLRLVLIPVFVILMIDPTRTMVLVAAWVFIAAAITDYVDGFIARKFSAVSDFGKLLDPLADKILVMSGLVMLLAQRSDENGTPWVPGAMVVLVLAREIWVTGLRGVAASRGLIVPAGGAGKIKSGFQMIAIVLLLLHDRPLSSLGIPVAWSCKFLGLNFLLISILFSLWSATEYTWSILVANRKE